MGGPPAAADSAADPGPRADRDAATASDAPAHAEADAQPAPRSGAGRLDRERADDRAVGPQDQDVLDPVAVALDPDPEGIAGDAVVGGQPDPRRLLGRREARARRTRAKHQGEEE